MDSITQFVLGAGIGVACLGKKHGLRKAALTGGVLGTIPDLDVFWDYGGPLENFVFHRSATHSLIVQTIATPLLAEGLWRFFKKPEGGRLAFYLAVFLAFTTHALLDATTIYGTQLLWPFTDYPFGVGSMFIIDPLYTLPLLFITLWALIRPKWTPAYGKILSSAFILSTAYLGWSFVAQSVMKDRAAEQFAARGIETDQILVIPLPFTTFAWKAIAIQPDTYTNLYLPLVNSSDEPIFYSHKRWPNQLTCAQLDNYPAHNILNAFTKGFYSLSVTGEDELVQADLRMGMTPNYVFQFEIQNKSNTLQELKSLAKRIGSERSQEGDLEWLTGMVKGDITIRPAERTQVLEKDQLLLAQSPHKCENTG
ncbi:metal-dependent hydrolase [Sneathiella sp. P13V-1]|uniref:metal-dependent hydrolase n=1 Tax=Sneathiella sp. P13V-1 TaxID=2697366 RepID=UPI00187BBB60|nr:metal-dependent hydrolase [Sneathiella sp. P13V-1]MBE7637760.1 metal-dependent hydrolase [Sneathiella sp. P13V-1]